MKMREEMTSGPIETIGTTEIQERAQSGSETTEQAEMDDFRQPESGEAAVEQAEMDAFEDNARLGKCLIYNPNEKEAGSGRNGRLGEYRVFADTRPGGRRYDIFADGKGK